MNEYRKTRYYENAILITLVILILVGVFRHEDRRITEDDFKVQLMKFQSKGARNTASQGYNLCKEINKRTPDHEPMDCCNLYFPEKSDKDKCI